MPDIEIKDIRKVRLDPEDVLVVRSDLRISRLAYERIKANMEALFPHNKIVVLEMGMTLEVVSPDPSAGNPAFNILDS